MATLVGTQKEIGKLLIELTELEYDAVEAYEAAVQRLDDPVYKTQLSAFMADHRQHIQNLLPLVAETGEKVPEKADIKAVLTRGKVVLGGLMGDKAILMAMRTNEEDTNTAYERATKRGDLPGHVRDVLVSHFADERRHKAYIDQVLGVTPETTVQR